NEPSLGLPRRALRMFSCGKSLSRDVRRTEALATAFPQPTSAFQPAENQERFQRVRINLLGRYMLADRREFPGQVVEMSPGDLVMIAPQTGAAGERVIAYIDHIGRVEGTISHLTDNGFEMRVGATDRKRDKLAAQLTWLANRELLNLAE